MPFVNERWLGGMLTNFQTVSKRVARLKELEEIDFDDIAGSGRTKKELLGMRREKEKLDKVLGGIRGMARTPSVLWVVDTNKEHLAVEEAAKLGIPVVGILDSNCDPDKITYGIPGNDDAIRSVGLLTRVISDAIAEGLKIRHAPKAGDAPVDGAAAEPLAEWEQELLGGDDVVAEESVIEAPAADAPVAEAPVDDVPVAEPEADEPAVEKPEVERPATKRPATKKPAAKKPAAEKPAAEKPAAKKPAAKKTADKE
jgi:small subunit ribosomal protein S2